VNNPHSPETVPALVDHLFRHKAGQMVSALTRYFGVENLELVEDIVQEALVKALSQWAYHGIPENPGGWLWSTAKHQALDVLRREARFRKRLQGEVRLIELEQAAAGKEADAYPFEDDQLSMIFLGCHPALTREAQIALVLNTVGGFSAAEIARAFLIPEATLAQRLVRAKQKLRTLGARFDPPTGGALTERLDSALDVLYLLFNEGYAAHSGATLIRRELCEEAIHLCRLMASHPATANPKTQALLALMLLQASRLPARTDPFGDVLLLEEQDRALWDRAMIAEGLLHLGYSAQGEVLTAFHLQAAIAAKHAQAESYAATDWAGIVADYDALLEAAPSPVVQLNRAVAMALAHGTQTGLRELEALSGDPALKRYHLFHAALGELYARNGESARAEAAFRAALALTGNEAERRFFERKLRG
jgi:RNA polymerase sigma factor (sigma-70 family)